MSKNTLTKKRRVINYLANGKGLTANEAKARFGVANLRATISDIKSLVEAYGNWEITSEATATGMTRYFMEDTHPGIRSYNYDDAGIRSAV
jgi:phospholipase/lecithinase/hemolysin|tara:strand:+ start:243 stop:515 length:273 start_codon:yes stop_codon:yes gene_type:complete